MASQPKLPLGVRKLARLLELEQTTANRFATAQNIDRHKLARILRGEMRHIDIDFVGRIVRAFRPGVIDPLDFEQRTVDLPDPGAEVDRKLRAVGAK